MSASPSVTWYPDSENKELPIVELLVNFACFPDVPDNAAAFELNVFQSVELSAPF